MNELQILTGQSKVRENNKGVVKTSKKEKNNIFVLGVSPSCGKKRTPQSNCRGTHEQGTKPLNAHIGPCDKQATRSGTCSAFARMQLG